MTNETAPGAAAGPCERRSSALSVGGGAYRRPDRSAGAGGHLRGTLGLRGAGWGCYEAYIPRCLRLRAAQLSSFSPSSFSSSSSFSPLSFWRANSSMTMSSSLEGVGGVEMIKSHPKSSSRRCHPAGLQPWCRAQAGMAQELGLSWGAGGGPAALGGLLQGSVLHRQGGKGGEGS